MTEPVVRKRPEVSALVVAAALFAVAAAIVIDANRLEITSTYGLGPKAVPFVIAAGLVLLGIGHVIMAFRGIWPEPEPGDPKAILLILGGLAALIAIIGLGGGFIAAAGVDPDAQGGTFDPGHGIAHDGQAIGKFGDFQGHPASLEEMNCFIKAGWLPSISSFSGRFFIPASRFGSGGGEPIA